MYKHILLPTDGSELSENAAKSCLAFAKSIGARVTGLYVLQEYTPILATEGFGYVDPQTVEQIEISVDELQMAWATASEQADRHLFEVIESLGRNGVGCVREFIALQNDAGLRKQIKIRSVVEM